MLLYWLVVVVYSVGAYAADGDNTCDASLCDTSSQNVTCGINNTTSSSCCSNANLFNINSDLIEVFVRRHNLLRGMVARGDLNGIPTAARMATVRWNPNLAKLAENIVRQCKGDSVNFCANSTLFPNAGQNSAVSRNVVNPPIFVVRQHIDRWFDTNEFATAADIGNFTATTPFGNQIRPFAQFVYDSWDELGCALLRQTNCNGNNNNIDQYTACVYNRTPKNNKPVYAFGSPTSQCNTGSNAPRFPNLCSPSEDYSGVDTS